VQNIKLKIDLLRDLGQKGIWQFSAYLAPLPEEDRLSLNEGNTPEDPFEEIFFKREDQNPTGSLKDRGMAYLISKKRSEGVKSLVLSSSGNAAVSAASYCRLSGIQLFVFVAPKINPMKLKLIQEKGVEVFQSRRPVSDAVKFAKEKKIPNLRPSGSSFGPEGFQTIAFELAINQGYLGDLFLPVSSGVSLKGIYEGFKKLGFLPRLHACQSTAVCPIARAFDKDFVPEKESLTDSLVAKFTPLQHEVIRILKESRGGGWVINKAEVREAAEKLEKEGITTSNEGALALAGYYKAREKGWGLEKTVCLLTGRKY